MNIQKFPIEYAHKILYNNIVDSHNVQSKTHIMAKNDKTP